MLSTRNNLAHTGKVKDDLAAKLAETKVLGGLPACPSCRKPTLVFETNLGEQRCKGSRKIFTNGYFKQIPCGRVLRGEQMLERIPFIELR